MVLWKRKEARKEVFSFVQPKEMQDYARLLRRLSGLVDAQKRELVAGTQIPRDERRFFEENLTVLVQDLASLAQNVNKIDQFLVERSERNPGITVLQDAELYCARVEEKEKKRKFENVPVRELDMVLAYLVNYKEQLEAYEGKLFEAVRKLNIHAIEEHLYRLREAFQSYQVDQHLLDAAARLVKSLTQETVVRDILERVSKVVRKTQDLIYLVSLHRGFKGFKDEAGKQHSL